jgi:hypothetical protein
MGGLLSPVTDTIKIELWENGTVMVSGSIQNKQHALNLVEAARDAILRYHEKNKPIVIPSAYEIQ